MLVVWEIQHILKIQSGPPGVFAVISGLWEFIHECRRRRPQETPFLTVTTAVVGRWEPVLQPCRLLRPGIRRTGQGIGRTGRGGYQQARTGRPLRLKWRGKVCWVVRRTEQNLADLKTLDSRLADPNSDVETQQPSYCKNATRSIKPEYARAGRDLHPPRLFADLPPGCCASRPRTGLEGRFLLPLPRLQLFDLAGRVFKGVLRRPTWWCHHQYLSDDVILIGVDGGAA